jgi:hypothetical protein
MPFSIKSRKPIETPLEAEYKKQIAWHVRDMDPSIPKPPPTQLRSFSLVEDVVTLSTKMPENSADQTEIESDPPANEIEPVSKSSEPVTPAEKNHLGIFSVRV